MIPKVLTPIWNMKAALSRSKAASAAGTQRHVDESWPSRANLPLLALQCGKNSCRKFRHFVAIAHIIYSLPIWYTFLLHKMSAIVR
jgi:hypothetical protein